MQHIFKCFFSGTTKCFEKCVNILTFDLYFDQKKNKQTNKLSKIQNLGVVGQCVDSLPSTLPPQKSARTNACSSYCFNGATCLGKETNVTCLCPSNYTGLRIFFYSNFIRS